MTKEIKEYLRVNASKHIIDELIPLLYIEFGVEYKKEQLRKILNYNKIPYKRVEMRKYNPKQKEYLLKISQDYTPRQLMEITNKKFGSNYTFKEFHVYLRTNKIPFKYEDAKKSHTKGKEYPLGSLGMNKGMVTIKVGKHKWIPKQRYIYEQYYGVKLKPNQFVIFLDGDRTNYNIDNLRVVDNKVAGYIGNYNLRSKNKQLSELGLNVAKLMVRTREEENG